MALYRWPTDPPGKPASHSISWQKHLANQAASAAQAQQTANQGQQNAHALALWNQGASNASAFPSAPAPAPPAAPAPAAAPPPDPAFEAWKAARTSQRDSNLAAIAAKKPQTLADYGYTASGYDSEGKPLGLTFDEKNPFSRASLLLSNYKKQQRGTQTSMAARGQFHSGALGRMKASNETGNLQANDALQKALVALLTGLAQAEGAERSSFETDVANYGLNRAPAP